MRTISIAGCVSCGLIVLTAPADGQHPDREAQIAGAVEALPEAYRADAEVRAWNENGDLESLRVGTNDFICLANRSGGEAFQSSCYHVALEPFMERGRALRKEGLDGMEYQQARWDLVQRGELAMPEQPAMVYNFYHGNADFDARTDDPSVGTRLHAIYMPYMTPESTGLPTEAPPGQPWLMWPGTPSSHVMIVIPPSGGPEGEGGR